ncbi:MAG TPA: hypothetical protein VFR56_02360 [Actinomycetes bacterium]|nr:hypothetical protein [Actinomycetes bacterium]
MSTVEDQVREALHDLADEARAAPLLQRLETRREAPARIPRSRLAVAAVAAAVVVLLVAALAIRSQHIRRIDPSVQPPKVLRLSEAGTLSPGRAMFAVSLAADSENDNTPAYVLPMGATRAVLLPDARFSGGWTQHLSADGTSFLRDSWVEGGGLEIVDLRSGRVDDLDGMVAECPTLSPDGRLIAADVNSFATLIDRDTGRSVRISGDPGCGYNSFGWAPDGDRLVVRRDQVSHLHDRRGRLLGKVPGGTLANSSMSWSPDGRDLLMYQSRTGKYAIVSADQLTVTPLRRPATTARAVGWTGDRVVWLVGRVGDQRLVTTDRDGRDSRLWTRLELGSRQVDNVSWSRAMTGRG